MKFRSLFFLAAAAVAMLAWPCRPVFADQAEETLSLEEFKASRFAVLFQLEDYAGALPELESLLRRYPEDRLLLRYRAITLDRLGRSEEAISQLRQLLRLDPEHVPTRYFLAQVYANAGRIAEAVQGWEWVAGHSAGLPYREWAQEGLRRFRPVLGAPAVPSRWFLTGAAGWEWDSNVLLKPEEKRLSSPGDRNADRFSLSLQAGTHLVRERDRAVDATYTTRHSFHDDGLDEFNFISQELALAARQRAGTLAGQPLWFSGRYDLQAGFLDEDLFSWSNRFTLGADSRLSPRTRTALTGQCALSNFGPDGSNPPQTSRDGVYSSVELAQYLYSADFRSYAVLSQAYTDARATGGNFERRGATTRLGAHLPLTRRIEADASVGFSWGRYPRFSSLSTLDLERRRDTDWDFYVALTRPLTPRLSGRLFYRLTDAGNRNDFFEYARHISGVQVLF
jgi:hypothetical protein